MRDYPRFDYLDIKVTKYQKAYAPSTVYRELMLMVDRDIRTLPANWAPGMIGLVPLFESRESAEAFAIEHDAGDRRLIEFIIPLEEDAQDATAD
jgi:hypothetical protein